MLPPQKISPNMLGWTFNATVLLDQALQTEQPTALWNLLPSPSLCVQVSPRYGSAWLTKPYTDLTGSLVGVSYMAH
jgi:hypothetical protein